MDGIPTRVFLGVVVAGCQQKTKRRDKEASQSGHRGNGLKGRGMIYVQRAIAQAARLGGASLNRPRTRRPRPRVGRVGWRRFCGQVSGEVFVPKGRNDSSLAVYCLGCGKKPNRPVRERYDWVGGTFCYLEW